MVARAGSIRVEDVAAHYDDLDRFYLEVWGEHVHHGLWDTGAESTEAATQRLAAAVAERAHIRLGDRVCDVGCGYGATARILAREYGATVTALTVSRRQYVYAQNRDRQTGDPRYLLRDWAANGLPANTFDAVIAIESSEHMPDLDTFFDEAYRVLKPGGRLVVCVWLAHERVRPAELRLLLDPICRGGRLRSLETASRFTAAARGAGFAQARVDDVSRHVKKTWPICAYRVAAGLVRDGSYRDFLLRGRPNSVFALTLPRIWLAYELGCMRYGILTAIKPIPQARGLHS